MNSMLLKLGLQDIELPPQGLSAWLVALIVLLGFVLLLLVLLVCRKRQYPLNQAKRQLLGLSTTSPDPDEIAKILREGFQVRQLKESGLPEDFIQRLQQARFSNETCNPETLIALKNEAQTLLMDSDAALLEKKLEHRA